MRAWLTMFRVGLAIIVAAFADVAVASGDDFIVVNAVIVDGTGAPARSGNVRVHDGRIATIGDVFPREGEQVVDARGLVLAPGFIDTHSHHDEGMSDHPDAIAAISQGITTIVVGQDGVSHRPLRDYFRAYEQNPAALNIASYTGHGSIRATVMGEDYRREATAVEVRAMGRLLAADMRAGSLGLSTGLEYDPGIYSSRQEIVDLALIAAAHRGRYISHIRSEDIALDAAIEELIDIGRRARLPVQISHMKLALTDHWGSAARVLARLDAARAEGVDVTADVYPYEYWQSDLTVLFPQRDFTDIAAAEFALTHLSTPEGMLLSQYDADPTLVGKTIAQIAAERGSSPAQTYLDLINESLRTQTANRVIGASMHRDDVANLILWPHSNVSSDGMLVDRHPRGAGAFTRVLAWLVRGERRLSLEAAIAKMTADAARHVGITGRGVLARGMAADMVLFDPDAVADRATIENPAEISVGIDRVWVNGVLVFADRQATGARPGRALRRGGR